MAKRSRDEGNRNRLPARSDKNLILIGQLAAALGWSTARLRGLDDLFKPTRFADGTRAYNVERAMGFVRFWDEFMAWSEARALRESSLSQRRAEL